MRTEEVCRRRGICPNTFYRWKAKYADMEISDVRKLKALESENARLNLIGMYRRTFRYRGKPRDDKRLREQMRELAYRWPRCGSRRLIVLLHREGIEVNHKKAYRIYSEEDLNVRRKRT